MIMLIIRGMEKLHILPLDNNATYDTGVLLRK